MAYKPMELPDFQFVGEHHVIREAQKEGGWTLELNKISWGGAEPKYDIRAWSPDHTKMGKGIGLTKKEAIALRDTLNILFDRGEFDEDFSAPESNDIGGEIF